MTSYPIALAFIILISLITKHFICDFLLQTEKQIAEKGDMGKAGGYVHAGIHAVMTFVVFFTIFPDFYMMSLAAGTLDFILHYAIDWSKVRVQAIWSLTTKDKMFWYLFGLDQYLHLLTYVGLAIMFVA
jgi:hypothetical protein